MLETYAEDMLRLYVEEGLSYTQIAKEYDTSRQRVHQIIGRKTSPIAQRRIQQQKRK